MDMPEEFQAASVASMLRTKSAGINAALLIHSDAINEPEGAGELVASIIGTTAELPGDDMRDIAKIIAATRRVAEEDGLFDKAQKRIATARISGSRSAMRWRKMLPHEFTTLVGPGKEKRKFPNFSTASQYCLRPKSLPICLANI